MPKYRVYLRGSEWVVDLPGPGDVKLVSKSKTQLEAELDRLDNLIKGASYAEAYQETRQESPAVGSAQAGRR